MKRSILWLFCFATLTSVSAQNSEENGQLKVSGYVQTQWKWDEAGVATGDQNDFSIRRGRLKADYKNKFGQVVFQVDVTESGVDIKDAYLKVPIPKAEWMALRAGVFDRPFGYEISYSSSRRESPERSRVFQTLFPKERDLGVEIALKGKEGTILSDFSLNAGAFSGNGGQAKETDSGKDFIGHLAYSKMLKSVTFGLGASFYYGGVRLAAEDTQLAYKIENKEFVEDATLTPGEYADRHYWGLDGQLSFRSIAGKTNLRGEYLWGKQAGAAMGSKSPTGKITTDIYLRNFGGYYIQLVHTIGQSRHSLVAKLDGYDPNTKLSGDECLTHGDVAYTTLGLGWLFQFNEQVRLTAYYEFNRNEKVRNDALSESYGKDLSDDQFTLRLQYKF